MTGSSYVATDSARAPTRVEHVSVGELGNARRERLRRSTAGLDPILTDQEASPAVTITATPDLCASPDGVSGGA